MPGPGGREKTSWVYTLIVLDPENNKRFCKPCKDQGVTKEIKCGKGNLNTTNMIRHLDTVHPILAHNAKQLADLEAAKKLAAQKSNASASKLHQLKMKEYLNKHKQKKMSLNDPRNKEFLKILAEFIIGANVAINTIDNPFFVYLIHKYLPIYTLPSRSYFTRNIIEEVQSSVNSKIKDILALTNYVSFTSDIWTAQHAQDSFISLTLHCLTINVVWHTAVLCCKPMPQNHTGANITQIINQMFVEQDMPKSKCFIMVTDNASTMLNGVRGANIESVGCLLHVLHLIIQNSIFIQPGVDKLLKKLKKLFTLNI